MAAGKDDDFQKLVSSLLQGWRHFQATAGGTPLSPFPILAALKGYGWSKAKSDLRAAANVVLLDLPQSMAYAAVAGLPLHYGPKSSVAASLTGPAFASSRLTILGPSNATAFMLFSYFAANHQLPPLMLMPLLLLMVGSLLIFGAWLRVADLTQYISRTVTVAYVTGAAVLIMATQLAGVLGVTLQPLDGDEPARTLPGIVLATAMQLPNTRWQSLVVAVITALCWASLKRFRPTWPSFIIALIVGTLSARLMVVNGIDIISLGNSAFSWRDLVPGVPEISLRSILPDLSRLFPLAMALAFLATLESTAMARALASRSGRRVDLNQDMLALGVSNLACAFIAGMPASGSLTRSALNHSSGAVSPLASIFNGILCLLGALIIMPFIHYVPKAALATLVILVAFSLIHKKNIRICLLSTNSDAITFLATFILTLFIPLHIAIFGGVGVSIMLYLRQASRPSLVEYEFNQEGNLAEASEGGRQHPAISIVHVEGELFFGAAELFRTQIQRISGDPNLRVIILRLKNARHLDATSVLALEELINVMRANDRDIIVSGAMKDVYRVLRDSGLVDVIGRDNIFPGSPSNPNLSTRKALKRAQEIIGSEEATVHIYYDPSKA